MDTGRKFRQNLRRPMPTATKSTKARVVPAFTIQALQKNVTVQPPPKAGALFKRPPKLTTKFRRLYTCRDIPIAIVYDTSGMKLAWKLEIEELNYHHYLPLFFEGLCETVHPYKFLAQQGIQDMLQHGGVKILPVIPQLIVPIENALNTRNLEIVCTTLKVIQSLVTSADMVGEALVPYYRRILPMFNIFKDQNVNLGDGIDYTQMYHGNVGELVQETLEILEQHGGRDAFINIKNMVPTYESCMLNFSSKHTI